jgi:hypothetical protein
MSKMKMGSWLAISWIAVGCSGGDPVVTPSVTPPNAPSEIVPPPAVPAETAPSVAAAPAPEAKCSFQQPHT